MTEFSFLGELFFKQNMVMSKCPLKLFISFTGSPVYEEFLAIKCHSFLYFAILTYINKL